MDGSRFDQLSRRLAGLRTRRQFLAALAGVATGALVGSLDSSAQACTPHYRRCGGDADCCAGAVCEFGRCMPGCRIDGAFASAWTSPPGNICQICTPELSTTSWSPANEGVSCWGGHTSPGPSTCRSGACAPVAAVEPVRCPPLTACHLEGHVDPVTGMCVYPFAPAGTPCGLGEMCHGGFYQPADACDGNGFCIGGGAKTVSCAPYTCAGSACATTCSADSECGSGTVCCDGQCVSLGTIDHCSACGNACAATETCVDGACKTPPSPTPTPVPLTGLGDECTILGSREECAQVNTIGGYASVVCAYPLHIFEPEYPVCLMESGGICGYGGAGGGLSPELCVSYDCTYLVIVNGYNTCA